MGEASRGVARAPLTPRPHRQAHPARIVRQQAPPAPAPAQNDSCTAGTWQSVLSVDERWIDEQESGLDPRAVNPASGAMGLGQLLPSTYRSLGFEPSWDPCAQILAQRAYMRHRYGSWGTARAYWDSHHWW